MPSTATTLFPSLDHRYLNLAPNMLDPELHRCFEDPEKCDRVLDLIYYSKDENVTDFSAYDWLITADPT